MTGAADGPVATQVRDFEDFDTDDVDRIALAAFAEF